VSSPARPGEEHQYRHPQDARAGIVVVAPVVAAAVVFDVRKNLRGTALSSTRTRWRELVEDVGAILLISPTC
jgi:hypothetical protein